MKGVNILLFEFWEIGLKFSEFDQMQIVAIKYPPELP